MDKVLLSKIKPDENQPRKLFDATKMRGLRDSIKREGIITPLVVEKVGDGFLLIDGERRFRAATELGLKEVPVIVEATRNATERAIRQFTIQEMHEGWSPVEKAVALAGLSEKLGIKLTEVCTLLNVTPHSTEMYLAFSKLADKEGFVRSEIPLDFVRGFIGATNAAKKAYEKQEKEFSRSDQKRLERRLIVGIKDGSIVKRKDVSNLSFAFSKDMKMIEKYIGDTKLTPRGMYLESGAQSVRALSNANFSANYIVNHLRTFMQKPDTEVSKDVIANLKVAKSEIENFLAKFDE